VKRAALKRALGLAFGLALAGGPGFAQPPHAPLPPPAGAGGVAGGMGGGQAPTPSQRLAAALSQIGMTTCAPAAQRAANFLFEDGEANFTVQPLGPDANRWPTVIVIEGAHQTMGRTRLSTLTVSPGPTCAGFYEQVIWWDMPCDKLKASIFGAFGAPRAILRNVQVSELNAGLQLYLTPAGTGCTSVKKELFH
jgi:hypothetical protein